MSKHVTTNAMTVDVEDYFHVAAFENVIKPESWHEIPHRVEKNTYDLMDLFDEKGCSATFFILGLVGEKYPALIKDIAARGHEVASHGYAHRRATTQSREEFKTDVERSKNHLEDLIGQEVLGYRAPSFSIDISNEWAFEVLVELGFKYSSSTYPVKHDLYGTPYWPRFKHQRKEGIIEIPIPTTTIMGKQIPIGGGGYFRLYPTLLTHFLVDRYLQNEKQPYSFYFHPWEIDAAQPKVENAPWKSKFRHYLNLEKMKQRLSTLLEKYEWSSMKDVYDISSPSPKTER